MINLATMVAGLEDRVMLAPEQQALAGMPDFGPAYDLVAVGREEDWDVSADSQLAIHQWVHDNLWPDLEHRVIGVISPGPPVSGEVPGTGQYYPMGLAARDYFVALRLPILYLNPVEPPESDLFNQFLDEAPSPVPLTGVFQEFEPGIVEIASDHGDLVAGITWPGVNLANGNLTVLGEAGEADAYQAPIDTDRVLATLGDAPVAMMYLKGGDALSGQLDRDQFAYMSWPKAQGSRFGWTTNPTIIDLAPLVWNSDLAIRNEVTLISGISGVGYARPHRMTPEQLADYLAATRAYFTRAGLRVVEIDIQEGPVEARIARAYYDALHDIGFLGILQSTPGDANFSYLGDVPTPVVSNEHWLLPDNAESLAQELLSVQSGVVTTDVGDPNGLAPTVADPDGVEGDAVVYRRADLGTCCLATAVHAEALAPGSYTATIRLKTPDASLTHDILNFYVLDLPSGQFLASRFIAPNDFDAAGEYQEFSISFDAQQTYLDLEVRVDYLGGDNGTPEVEMVVDTISFGPDDGPALPPFTTVFINDDPNLTEGLPAQFQAAFEAGGGLLLTPDEFFAALDPEYMLELATPLLGADHPAVVEAKALMDQHEFLQALLRIRAGLKDYLDG